MASLGSTAPTVDPNSCRRMMLDRRNNGRLRLRLESEVPRRALRVLIFDDFDRVVAPVLIASNGKKNALEHKISDALRCNWRAPRDQNPRECRRHSFSVEPRYEV